MEVVVMRKFNILGQRVTLYTWSNWSQAKKHFMILGLIPLAFFCTYGILVSYEVLPNILILWFGM